MPTFEEIAIASRALGVQSFENVASKLHQDDFCPNLTYISETDARCPHEAEAMELLGQNTRHHKCQANKVKLVSWSRGVKVNLHGFDEHCVCSCCLEASQSTHRVATQHTRLLNEVCCKVCDLLSPGFKVVDFIRLSTPEQDCLIEVPKGCRACKCSVQTGIEHGTEVIVVNSRFSYTVLVGQAPIMSPQFLCRGREDMKVG